MKGVAAVEAQETLHPDDIAVVDSGCRTDTAERRVARGETYSCRSSFVSHMSTETRVPGVSAGSIAAKASPPVFMSAALSKSWSTTAVP